MYARLTDILGTQTRNLKTLLPNVSNPENLTAVELEALGIVAVEVIRDPVQWWQTRGEPVVDDTVRPVTITYTAIERPLAEVQAQAERIIDAERDQRIESGFVFAATQFQSRASDRENIAGTTQLATLAVMAGAQQGDLYWHDGVDPFAWIAADNSLVLMDAQTVIQFGQAAAAHKHALIFQARAMKNAAESATTVADVVSATVWG